MSGYTPAPRSFSKAEGRIVYRYFPAIDGGMAAGLDSKLIIFENEETKKGEGRQMSKKLTAIQFKPKPRHYDQFLADVLENGKDREPNTHFTVTAGDEVIAVVIRDAVGFEESAKEGVFNWLDERRPMLQEYDPVNRHTIPLSGDLVE